MRSLGVLVSGRGSNLRALHAATEPGGVLSGVARIAVVASDKPECGGLAFARERRLPTIALPVLGRSREVWDAALADALDVHEQGAPLDLLVLAGFMRILSAGFVARYAGRIVNIHPADTRVHQGLGGYAYAHAAGLAETWITVHLVDAGLDTGQVLGRRAVDLRDAGSLEEIERRGLQVEHALYSETLRDLLLGERGAENAAR
ncbi:MAG: phosphoribosylglycinamide formyltransferase [Myxococcales bacterium]|nr:phosphoribosylglycinamide formyltransferase [Myxococcales bacterium]